MNYESSSLTNLLPSTLFTYSVFFFTQEPGLCFSSKVLISLFCFKYSMAPLTFKLKFISTELTIFQNSTQLEPSWLSPHHFPFTLTLFCNGFELCTVSRTHCPVSHLQDFENGVPTPWNPLNSFYHISFYQSILYYSVQILSSLKISGRSPATVLCIYFCHNPRHTML